MVVRMSPRFGVVFLAAFSILAGGCAKQVNFQPLPLAGGGKATAKVELTFDRNNSLEVKLSGVPDPSSLKPGYSRYVLWAATPDRQHVVNIGQLRVDEKKNAEINTLTPLRSFLLFITVEPSGEVMAPGPDVIFEAPPTEW